MQININSDRHVQVNQQTVEQWRTDIEEALERFSDWITRVEVHVTDQNSLAKGGADDIRCVMEARPAGKQPVSIDVRAESAEHAIQEGTGKLKRRLAAIADKARTEARGRR